MSTNILPHRRNKVKPAPSREEIPALWWESIALESFAPSGLRGGLARMRTRLLDVIPAWQLPAFLDQLQEVAI